MKLKLLSLLLLSSIGVSAQTFVTFGNGSLQRKIVGTDTSYRSPGTVAGIYLYSRSEWWIRNNLALATDGQVSGLTPSLVGDDLTISSGSYRKNSVIYTKSTSTVFNNIPLSGTGKQRYIVVVGNTSSVIDTVGGAQSAIAIMPSISGTQVAIATLLVGESSIFPPVPDLSGYVPYSNYNLQTATNGGNSTDKNIAISTVNSFPTMGITNSGTIGFPLVSLSDGRSGGINWNIENGRTIGKLGFYSGGESVVSFSANGDVDIAAGAQYKINGVPIGGGGGSGTVTSVSSANGDISVATGTTTPVLTLNSGSGANQIVKRNGSGVIPDVASGQTIGANTTGNSATSTVSDALKIFGGSPETILATNMGSSNALLNATGGKVVDITGNAATVTNGVYTSDLALKANIASPTFTGTPTAPTPSAIDNSTNLATTAYVQAKDALVVHTTGNETIAGVKTFSSNPILSALAGGGNRGLTTDNSGNIGGVTIVDRLSEGYLSKTANYTVLASDFGSNGWLTLDVDATAGNVTITLPNLANMNGLNLKIVRVDGSGNTVTISGAVNINGSSTASLTSQWGWTTISAGATTYRAIN